MTRCSAPPPPAVCDATLPACAAAAVARSAPAAGGRWLAIDGRGDGWAVGGVRAIPAVREWQSRDESAKEVSLLD